MTLPEWRKIDGLVVEPGAARQRTSKPSRFRSLIEKMPISVTLLRGDGVVLFANAETEALTGYEQAVVEGRPFWLEAVHPEDAPKLTDAFRRSHDGEQQVTVIRFMSKRRGPRLVELHVFPSAGDHLGLMEALAFDVTERIEIEEALFQSEALYRVFLEQSPIGMLHLDAAGTVTFENHQFRQIVGETPDDAWLGRSILSIDGLDTHLTDLFRRMLEEGSAIESESATYHRSSFPVAQHLTFHGSAIRHPDGGIVGGVVMVEDHTEEVLRRAEIELRTRYGSAETALREVALSEPSESTFLNEAARILGQTCGADRVFLLMANSAGDCCTDRARWHRSGDADDRKLLILQSEHPALLDIDPGSSIHRVRDERCSDALLDLTGAAEAVWMPFWDESRLGGFVVLERQRPLSGEPSMFWSRAERQLIEQLVGLFETLWTWMLVGIRYRHITGAIDDSLFHFTFNEDGERRFLFLTSQIEYLTGYSATDLLADGPPAVPWSDVLVHEDDRGPLDRHDDELRRGKESRALYRIHHADGSIRWIREQATPVTDASGDIVVSGILTDISEQKQAEQVLIEAKHQAESSNELKSAFIATMSHEIRTPMGALNGFAELLGREMEEFERETATTIPPQISEFLLAIQENSKKLLMLVNDLFDLANLEEGSVDIRATTVPLNDLAERSARKIDELSSTKGLDLQVNLSAAEPTVVADPRRLEQVLDNLLSNAVKFTENGSITIRTDVADRDRAILEVADTGVGISQGHLDRLFDPFVQEDSRLNREFEGSGLGLSLVKRLLDLMNGSIRVESRRGSGSSFEIALPIHQAEGADR